MSMVDRDKWNRRYAAGAYADRTEASALLQAWVAEIQTGRALDVACGAGRNALYLAERGFEVDGVDISAAALSRVRSSARQRSLRLNLIEHDLDQPLALDTAYQLILVIRYVNLPLMRQLKDYLAPGGLLICEHEGLVTEPDGRLAALAQLVARRSALAAPVSV